jgi:hypothetical protein
MKDDWKKGTMEDRRIFEPNRKEVAGAGEDCLMRSFVTCTLHQILLG